MRSNKHVFITLTLLVSSSCVYADAGTGADHNRKEDMQSTEQRYLKMDPPTKNVSPRDVFNSIKQGYKIGGIPGGFIGGITATGGAANPSEK
ncbi:exported hypothetical protein [Gammaproteobacteria bacterium]